MAQRNFSSTDLWEFLGKCWPVVGTATHTGATKAVVLASIEATDIVLATALTASTSAYVLKVAITAGTGFVITLSGDPGSATVGYAVFKNNS